MKVEDIDPRESTVTVKLEVDRLRCECDCVVFMVAVTRGTREMLVRCNECGSTTRVDEILERARDA
jgi:hypothetical protein